MQGLLLEKVPPVYPPEARAKHISGTVVLHAIIGKDGHIASLSVLSGPDILAEAAMDAVRQWIYKPYLLNGEPTEIDSTMTLNFNIGGDPAPLPPASPVRQNPGSGRTQMDTEQLRAYVIHKVPPTYPAAAKQAHVAGSVVLHAIIGTDGRIASLSVLSGPLELQQSALDAVSQWTYRPYVVDGAPREVDTEITVNYAFGG